MYQERILRAPDMNLFHIETRCPPPDNDVHMLMPGYPAQNWCLEVELESNANREDAGFDKVNICTNWS